MLRVANQDCYEMMIYKWAMRLFEKDVSSDHAIDVIHRTRRYVLINKKHHPTPQGDDALLNEMLNVLHEHSNYNQLNDHHKVMIQKTVIEVLNDKMFEEQIRAEHNRVSELRGEWFRGLIKSLKAKWRSRERRNKKNNG
ncbi:hypothetical protein [Aquimarina macrocephali]|uniref:hypothetical protein n=1 Tax=Aquimarina macrocephali TaxID=666563 RepID=UPI0012681E02|nr:hypothetical protein [Aquimarina macrocephali]